MAVRADEHLRLHGAQAQKVPHQRGRHRRLQRCALAGVPLALSAHTPIPPCCHASIPQRGALLRIGGRRPCARRRHRAEQVAACAPALGLPVTGGQPILRKSAIPAERTALEARKGQRGLVLPPAQRGRSQLPLPAGENAQASNNALRRPPRRFSTREPLIRCATMRLRGRRGARAHSGARCQGPRTTDHGPRNTEHESRNTNHETRITTLGWAQFRGPPTTLLRGPGK